MKRFLFIVTTLFITTSFSSAQNLKLKGIPLKRNQYSSLLVKDTIAFAFHTEGLSVWSIAETSDPYLVKEYNITGILPLLHGNRLFIAEHNASKILAIDISDIYSIKQVGSIDYTGFLNNFYANNNTLFVAVNGTYLQIFDLKDDRFLKIFSGLKMFVNSIDFMDSLFCYTNGKHLLRYYITSVGIPELYDSINFNNERLEYSSTFNNKTLVTTSRDTTIEGDLMTQLYSTGIYSYNLVKQLVNVLLPDNNTKFDVVLFNDSNIALRFINQLYLYTYNSDTAYITDIMNIRNSNFSSPIGVHSDNKVICIPALTEGFFAYQIINNKLKKWFQCPIAGGSFLKLNYSSGYIWVESTDKHHQVFASQKTTTEFNGDFSFYSESRYKISNNFLIQEGPNRSYFKLSKITSPQNIQFIDSFTNCSAPHIISNRLYYNSYGNVLLNAIDLSKSNLSKLFESYAFPYDGLLERVGLFFKHYSSLKRDSVYINAYHTRYDTPVFNNRIGFKLEQPGDNYSIGYDNSSNRVYISFNWGKSSFFIDYSNVYNPSISDVFRYIKTGVPSATYKSFYVSSDVKYIFIQKINNNGITLIDSIIKSSYIIEDFLFTDSILYVCYTDKVVSYDLTYLNIGITENLTAQKSHFKLYPNPNSSVLNIESPYHDIKLIKIMNSSGIEVFNSKVNDKHFILKHHLNSGLYFISVYYNNNVQTQKLIIE